MKDIAGKTALLCYTLVLVAADYTAQLTAAGMPSGLPNDINMQKDAIAEAWCNVEYGRRLRHRFTKERIKQFNTLWDLHMLVRNAALSIFRNNKVVAEQFE